MATNPDFMGLARGLETLQDGIRIHWSDGHSNFYHFFWLRSACHCELCGGSHNGRRLLHPSDVPVDILADSVALCGDRLNINWPGGHASEYELQRLYDFAYDDDRRDWKPQLWDASLKLDEVSHRYDEITADDARFLDFLRNLRDYGIAIVRGSEAAGIEKMAGLIGDINKAAYNDIFDLKLKPDTHNFGNTQQRVPPHTDESYLHTPTGILVLYCVKPASEGGESVLVDGFQVATRLREQDPESFEVLCRCPQANHRIVPGEGLDYRTRACALSVDEHGELVGFRFHPRSMAPIDVGGELAKKLHVANYQLSELILREANQICFQLQAGEAVFFDNHRVMHSRKAFADPERFLQICNLAREQFHQKLRLTARAQGCHEELRLKLPAGACG